MYFNYNGKTYSETEKIIGPANRGLRYGDGVFETLKLRNGKLILADEHFARLWKGMGLLRFDIPKRWSPEKFEAEILQLAVKNTCNTARVRLTVFRGDGGLYDAKSNCPNYCIEATSLPEPTGMLNTNGLQLCIYRDAVKSQDAFSNIKHNNFLPYLTGALFAKENRCNDALLLNSSGRICDSTIANVFFIKDEIVTTPALTEGCIAGVMRSRIISRLKEAGFTVKETTVTPEMLKEAHEIFLTNSIYNIRWVGSIEEKKYVNTAITKICRLLTATDAAVFGG